MSSRPNYTGNNDDEDDDSESTGPYLGTRMGVTTNARAHQNAGVPIQQFEGEPGRQNLGMFSRHAHPTIWEAVNYPHEKEFSFESFFLRYVRQSEARAVIDKPANDAWQSNPIIHDEKHKDVDEPVSAFERAVAEFLEGEHTRRKPIHRLNTLHKLSRLGHYAILVLGFNDGRPLSTPVAGITNESIDGEELQPVKDEIEQGTVQVPKSMNEPEFDSLDDLMYLSVFAEDRVKGMHIQSDMKSERFRLPYLFDVITEKREHGQDDHERNSDFKQQDIHWSRVIHTPEGTLENDLEGVPALKPIFHELLNIDKIKAASGEGYWRAGYTGVHISPPTDPTGTPMEFEDGGEGVHQEMQNYLNNFEREISTPAEINTIDVQVADPMPHLEANYQSISAATDIPKSILTGEDRADTASSDDTRQWHQKVGQIRNNFAGPVILEPLIQRMIDSGILPEPEGDGFHVEWQPLDELSEQDKWDMRQTASKTIKDLSPGGDTSQFGEIGELRQAIGWGPRPGSEIDEREQETEEQEVQSESEEVATERELEIDESYLPDVAMEDVDFPDELYDIPTDAANRAEELGIEGYHVRRVDGVTFYMPGDTHDQLTDALARDANEQIQQETQTQSTAETNLVAVNSAADTTATVNASDAVDPVPPGGAPSADSSPDSDEKDGDDNAAE